MISAQDNSRFVADCADLPVRAEGTTADEAIKNLRAAIQTYLERDENPFADYVLITEESS